MRVLSGDVRRGARGRFGMRQHVYFSNSRGNRPAYHHKLKNRGRVATPARGDHPERNPLPGGGRALKPSLSCQNHEVNVTLKYDIRYSSVNLTKRDGYAPKWFVTYGG